jgi:hypothetical protein
MVTLLIDEWHPPKLVDVFWGGLRVLWPSKHSFAPEMMNHHNLGRVWGLYTPSTAPKIISANLEGYWPLIRGVSTEHKASCGALGGHFCRQQLWWAMVVLVDVGHWRLTSDDWPTVGIVKNVYGSIFYSYLDPIHSWHLNQQLNKEDLDFTLGCVGISYAPSSTVDAWPI